MSAILKIRSLLPAGGSNLSLEGSDKSTAKVVLRPFREVDVPIYSVQFDQAWLELLANYVERSFVRVTLNGYVLSADTIRELKHTDINEVVAQYFESEERDVPDARTGYGRYYTGLDSKPHFVAGDGTDYDLSSAGSPPAEVVTVAVSGAQFTSVKAAVESILDASVTKPYLVSVAPGIYTEGPFELLPFIKLQGSGRILTKLVPSDDTEHFITVNPSSSIRDLQMCGPETTCKAAIHLAVGGGLTRVDEVAICQGYYGILVEPSTLGHIECHKVTYNETGHQMHAFLRAADRAHVQVTDSRVEGDADSVEIAFEAEGPNVRLTLIDPYHEVPASAVETVGARLNDGALLRVQGGVFRQGHTAIQIGPDGSSSLRTQATMIHRALGGSPNYVHDLDVQTVNASINVGGFMSRDKMNDPFMAPDFFGSIVNHEDDLEGACALGELIVGTSHAAMPMLSYAKSAFFTGLVSGGAVTEGGLLVANVAAGVGFINDSPTSIPLRVVWGSGHVDLSANKQEYIYVDKTGAICHAEMQPEYKNVIMLAQAVTSGTKIVAISGDEVALPHTLSRLQEFFEDVIGPLTEAGCMATKSAAHTAKKIDVGSGVWFIGLNEREVDGGLDVPFTYVWRDGAGGWVYTDSTTIQTDKYDANNPLGPQSPPGVDHFVKSAWYILVNGDVEEYFCVMGQTCFNDLAAAQAGALPSAPDILAHYGLLSAGIITDSGSPADVVATQDLRPFLGQNSPITAAVPVDHDTLLNRNLDNNHLQYLTTSRADTWIATKGAGDNVCLVAGGNTHAHTGGAGAQIDHANLSNKGTNTHPQIDSHIGSTSNPHATSKTQVGLGNVTNDAQIPLAQKAAASGVASLDGSSKVVQDPANATAIPTASKIAIADLSGKLDGWVTSGAVAGTPSLRTLGTGATDACAGNDGRLSDPRSPTAHALSHTTGADQISDATALAHGLMSAAAMSKLDGITAGAAVASVSGSAPITSSGGTTPSIGISAATAGAAGSMSAADKAKLDGVAAGATANHYGENRQTAVDTTRTTNATSTWTNGNKLTLTTPGGLNGTYVIRWNALLDNTNNGQVSRARLWDNTAGAMLGQESVFRNTNAVERAFFGGAYDVVLSGTAKTFILQFAADANTAGCSDARLEFYRAS